eukprot:1142334-Pelagomonas_calceolata.AAC.1
MHLIEIKYCEDTRPGRQLEAAQQQHADLCKNINGKVVMLHTILLGVGGTCYTEHTLHQFKQVGLDHQCAIELAHKLHAPSVQYAHELVITRCAIENSNTSCSQLMEPGRRNIIIPISLLNFECVDTKAKPGHTAHDVFGQTQFSRLISGELSPVSRGGEKMPSIGGSHWEALSLMHAAERQA